MCNEQQECNESKFSGKFAVACFMFSVMLGAIIVFYCDLSNVVTYIESTYRHKYRKLPLSPIICFYFFNLLIAIPVYQIFKKGKCFSCLCIYIPLTILPIVTIPSAYYYALRGGLLHEKLSSLALSICIFALIAARIAFFIFTRVKNTTRESAEEAFRRISVINDQTAKKFALNWFINDYPNTPSAEEAAKLLETLNQSSE